MFLEICDKLVAVRVRFSGDSLRIIFGFRQEIFQAVGVFDPLVWMLVVGCDIGHTMCAAGDAGGPAGGRCRCLHGVGAFKYIALCLLIFFESAALFINVAEVFGCVCPCFVGRRFGFLCGELLLFEDIGCIHLFNVYLYLSRRVANDAHIHAFFLCFGEGLFIGHDVRDLVPWGMVGRQSLCAFVDG